MTAGPVRYSLGAALALSLCAPGPAGAGGLSTPLGEVVIENLQIGRSYSLRELANLALDVTNTSAHPVALRMEVQVPGPEELKQNAEPIPAVAWIALSADSFFLGAGERATAEIRISIPDDERHLGKMYQVMIWSRSVVPPGGGMALAFGLKSRIIFTVDTVRADPREVVAASGADAAFTLAPQEIRLEGVARGRRWDVEEETGVLLTVSNRSSRPCTVRLRSRRVADSRATLMPGYEDTPDPDILSFSERELQMPPGETRTVRLVLDFPTDRGLARRKFMFIIHGETVGDRVSTGVYARLFAALE